MSISEHEGVLLLIKKAAIHEEFFTDEFNFEMICKN